MSSKPKRCDKAVGEKSDAEVANFDKLSFFLFDAAFKQRKKTTMGKELTTRNKCKQRSCIVWKAQIQFVERELFESLKGLASARNINYWNERGCQKGLVGDPDTVYVVWLVMKM